MLFPFFKSDLRVIQLEKDERKKRLAREAGLAQADAVHCHLDELECRLEKVEKSKEKRNESDDATGS